MIWRHMQFFFSHEPIIQKWQMSKNLISTLYTQNIIFDILRIHNQIVTIPISTLSKSAQCHPCQSDRSHTLSIFAREVLITTTRTSSSMQSKVLNKLKGWNNRLIIIGIFDIGFSGDIFFGPHSHACTSVDLHSCPQPNTKLQLRSNIFKR